MPIAAAQMKFQMAATANDTFAVTTQTAQTAKQDSFVYSNGTANGCITATIDRTITIAANSTTVLLSSLTDTIDNAFAGTRLKGWRIAAPSTNTANAVLSSNVTGLWTGTIHANTAFAMATGGAGFAIAGTNNITVAGNNNDTVTVTLFVS